MQRPDEFDTLISKGFFEQVPATKGAAQALLQNVREHLKAYEVLTKAGLTNSAFGAVYEGLSQLLQAMFEYYEVRASGDLRASGGYVVCKSLDMHAAELLLISRMHSQRNRLSTECPFPPAAPDESRALARLIEKYLPVVQETVTFSSEPEVLS